MIIPITNRKIKKILRELESECQKENPEGFALFGQLKTDLDTGDVELYLGSFNKKECEKIENIISQRKNKEVDIKRNEKLALEFLK
jgi:hypothetical protein